MTRTEKLILLIVLFTILAIVTFGCSTAIQDSPLNFVDGNGSHPAGWITAHGTYADPDGSLCMDCHGDDLAGGISGASCSAYSYNGQSCHASGPELHPADWLNKNASGDTWHADAYQEGLLQGGLDCLDCHTPPARDDPNGGKCLICHFDLNGSRTPGGWIHGTTDHGDFAGLPEEIVCVTCHEVNNRFGNEPTCHNCHTIVTVPHTNGWLDRSASDFHALAYSPIDDSCNVCHDPAQPANPPGYICLDCHFSEDGSQRTPPGSSYTHGETSLEHKTFTANEAQVCINCHNTNLDYANQDSCHNCHDLVNVPHTSGWLDRSAPDFHAQEYSPADDSCSVCHDPAQPANGPGYICLDCHFSEDGSQRTPPGSSYTHGETSSEHKTFTANEAQVCINCHTTNFDNANQTSCHNCHDIQAAHTVEYLDHNLAVPTSSDFTSQCSSCHSLSGTSPVVGAPVCISCHTDGSPYSQTNCTSCHRRPPGTGEHGKHIGEASCDDCHQSAGSDSGLNHFYDDVVDVVFSVSGFTFNGSSCTGSCHGENHSNRNW